MRHSFSETFDPLSTPKHVGGKWAVRVTKSEDSIVPKDELLEQIRCLCEFLNSLPLPKYEKCVSKEAFESVRNAVEEFLGFGIKRQRSLISGGGVGVAVSKGTIERGKIVAIYPGTIYRPGEPVFIQSIANPYLFRCADGLLIDGSDRGMSRLIYSSCTFRDRCGSTLTSDLTWLTSCPVNPLSIGQYVNNSNAEHAANVAYQEIDIPLQQFLPALRRFIPIVYYSSLIEASSIRLVVLVSSKSVQASEELFSSYFTVIT